MSSSFLPPRTHTEQLNYESKFLDDIENGYFSTLEKTHPTWLEAAIEHDRPKVAHILLSAYGVPPCDNLKQRVAYYQLMGKSSDNYKGE